jgi:pimeloyl-ACP methyl ester carboxylesterase
MSDPPTRALRGPHRPDEIDGTQVPPTQPAAGHAADRTVPAGPAGAAPRATPAGARIVLVPGLGLDGRSWARVRRRLAAAGVPAEVALLPGAGRRVAVPPLAELADLLRARLGRGPVVLAGHSQGCQVAAAVAGDPRVTGLVLLGPSTDPRLRSARALALRWLRTALREPKWQLPLVLAQWSHTGPGRMRALWRQTSPDRIDLRLPGLEVPVVVVRGRRDRLCDADWARSLAAAAPAGRLAELAGAAHMTVQTRPDAVAALLVERWADLLSQDPAEGSAALPPARPSRAVDPAG